MIQPSTNAQQLYPQPAGANAVSINIYNPQAYAGAPKDCQAPYAYSNSLYQMPQTSAYQQQVNPEAYQQLMPVQNPTVIAPAPQVMPQSVMNETNAANEANTAEPKESEQPAQTVDVDALLKGLKEADADKKSEAINKIAAYAQESPEVALQIVSEPVMNGLLDIIKEDTTSLEGPSEEQVKIAEKISKGEKLTPEEEKLSEQLSPRDKANKNRIFALYTLAMIQKLQRDELDQYIETQKANGQEPIAPLKLEDLIGYNDMANIINNDARPEVKVAAIQALQHVAKPEDKASIEKVLADAKNSKDEAVKQAAEEALSKFA